MNIKYSILTVIQSGDSIYFHGISLNKHEADSLEEI